MTPAVALPDVGKVFVRDDGTAVEVLGGLDREIASGAEVERPSPRCAIVAVPRLRAYALRSG